MKRYIKSDINSYSYTGRGFADDSIIFDEYNYDDGYILFKLDNNLWIVDDSGYTTSHEDYYNSYPADSLGVALDDFNSRVAKAGGDRNRLSQSKIAEILKEYGKSINDYLDGGFYEDVKSSTEIKASNDQSFEYQLLDRLRSDCDYVLNTYYRPEVQGDVSREERKLAQKFLWANNAKDQIAKMKELYRKLKVKPEWITLEDIAEYERQFKEILGKDYHGDHKYVGASNNKAGASMKRYIKSSNRYVLYEGQQLALQEGETKTQAISRFRAQKAQEEADALEVERIAKEEKEARRIERRKTPRYKDGTVVLTKDGKYYEVWQGYYYSPDDEVYYEAFPCLEDGKPNWDEIDSGGVGYELGQKEIQRKIS